MRTYYGYSECLVWLAADLGCICLHKNKQTKSCTVSHCSESPSLEKTWHHLLTECGNHLDCCKHAIETPKKETHRQSKPEVCTESKSHTEYDPEYQPNVLGRCQLLSYLEAPSYLWNKCFWKNLCNRHGCTNFWLPKLINQSAQKLTITWAAIKGF